MSLTAELKQIYRAGSVHHLRRGDAKQYKMHEGCFALEYARGMFSYPHTSFNTLASLHTTPRTSSSFPCHYDYITALTHQHPPTSSGWIPLMLPFGLADVLSSTLDLPSFIDTAYISAREMGRNLLVGKI